MAFQGFRQRVGNEHPGADDQGYVTIAPEKALVFIHGQHRNPLNGTSDLQTAYACFQSKQKVRFLWYQFLENQTLPKTIGVTANGNETAFANKIAALKGNGVIAINDGESVTPLESNGTGAAIFQAAMNYLDQELFVSCLAGFADLAGAASQGRGSFALSKDQSDFFLRSRQAVLSEMAACLSNFAIADLVRWNLGRQAKAPSLRFGELTAEDVSDVVAVFQALATSVTVNPTWTVSARRSIRPRRTRRPISCRRASTRPPGLSQRPGSLPPSPPFRCRSRTISPTTRHPPSPSRRRSTSPSSPPRSP
jgi:hypothetical protein